MHDIEIITDGHTSLACLGGWEVGADILLTLLVG